MISGAKSHAVKAMMLGCGLMVAAWSGVARAQSAPADDAPRSIQYDAVLTLDTLDNLSGGVRTGAWSMANLDLTAAWQGNQGWEAFGYVLADAHGGFSERYVGDAQVLSNIDAPPGVRLFEAWVRHTSDDQSVIATAGLINLNGMFDTQPTAGLFLNSSHGMGPDYAQSGPSIFPISGLGAVMEWHATDTLRLRAGVFDGLPGDPDHGGVFTSLKLSRTEGVNYVFEAEQNFDGGFVKLGHWTYSAPADRLDGAGQGRRNGTYGQISYQVTHEAGDTDQGLGAWIRAGVTNAQVFDVASYVGGGVVYAGPLPGRDHDQAGLAIATARFGKPWRALNPDGAGEETTVEASYQVEVKPGLIVQPDVQYVRHPGGMSDVKDALVVGVRLRIGLMG